MDNKSPTYSIGDIIQHNEYPDLKRVIMWIFTAFYDETGLSSEIYYQTKTLENARENPSLKNEDSSHIFLSFTKENDIPPTAIKEANIDLYYTKIQVHQ